LLLLSFPCILETQSTLASTVSMFQEEERKRSNLEKENLTLKSEIDSLRVSDQKLNKDLHSRGNELALSVSRYEKLETQLEDKDKTLNKSEELKCALEDAKKRLEQDNEKLNSDRIELKGLLAESKKEFTSVQNEINQLKDIMKEMEQRIFQKNAVIRKQVWSFFCCFFLNYELLCICHRKIL
jgi:chromosome segregation ATPase